MNQHCLALHCGLLREDCCLRFVHTHGCTDTCLPLLSFFLSFCGHRSRFPGPRLQHARRFKEGREDRAFSLKIGVQGHPPSSPISCVINSRNRRPFLFHASRSGSGSALSSAPSNDSSRWVFVVGRRALLLLFRLLSAVLLFARSPCYDEVARRSHSRPGSGEAPCSPASCVWSDLSRCLVACVGKLLTAGCELSGMPPPTCRPSGVCLNPSGKCLHAFGDIDRALPPRLLTSYGVWNDNASAAENIQLTTRNSGSTREEHSSSDFQDRSIS